MNRRRRYRIHLLLPQPHSCYNWSVKRFPGCLLAKRFKIKLDQESWEVQRIERCNTHLKTGFCKPRIWKGFTAILCLTGDGFYKCSWMAHMFWALVDNEIFYLNLAKRFHHIQSWFLIFFKGFVVNIMLNWNPKVKKHAIRHYSGTREWDFFNAFPTIFYTLSTWIFDASGHPEKRLTDPLSQLYEAEETTIWSQPKVVYFIFASMVHYGWS